MRVVKPTAPVVGPDTTQAPANRVSNPPPPHPPWLHITLLTQTRRHYDSHSLFEERGAQRGLVSVLKSHSWYTAEVGLNKTQESGFLIRSFLPCSSECEVPITAEVRA